MRIYRASKGTIIPLQHLRTSHVPGTSLPLEKNTQKEEHPKEEHPNEDTPMKTPQRRTPWPLLPPPPYPQTRAPYSSAHPESLLLLSLLKARSKRIFSRHTGNMTTTKHRFRTMQLLAAVDGKLMLKVTQRMLRADSSAASRIEGREISGAICGVWRLLECLGLGEGRLISE